MAVTHRTVVSIVGKSKVIVDLWVNEMQVAVNGFTSTFPLNGDLDDVQAALREAVSA